MAGLYYYYCMGNNGDYGCIPKDAELMLESVQWKLLQLSEDLGKMESIPGEGEKRYKNYETLVLLDYLLEDIMGIADGLEE